MSCLTAGTRILWIAVVLVMTATAGAAQDTVAITRVTVVDVTDGSLHTDQTVLIVGIRISAVGDAGEIVVPGEANVVDGSNAYLIPGLWDMHGHGASADRIQSFSRLYLGNGITGFRDPFGSFEVAAQAERAVAAGELPGPPRIIAAGNLIDGPGSTVTGASVAATPDDGRRIVDSLRAAGAPFIKAYHGLSPGTFLAIAERARELGLEVVGHVPILMGAAEASAAGLRSIEHLTGVLSGCSSEEAEVLADWQTILQQRDMAAIVARYMDPPSRALGTQDDEQCQRLMEQFVANQTWQVPTLVSLQGKAYLRERAADGDPRERYFTPASRWTGGQPFGFPMTEDQWRVFQAQYEREKQIVGIMAGAGVPILAGTDVATPWVFPGFGLHDELQLLVEAGLTPLQALQSATLNPARFLGRTDELGTVATGKLADLVLLEGNPLEDISRSQQIRAVVANGRLYRKSDLNRLLEEVAAANRKR